MSLTNNRCRDQNSPGASPGSSYQQDDLRSAGILGTIVGIVAVGCTSYFAILSVPKVAEAALTVNEVSMRFDKISPEIRPCVREHLAPSVEKGKIHASDFLGAERECLLNVREAMRAKKREDLARAIGLYR